MGVLDELVELGLGKKASAAYLALLRLGAGTAAEIAVEAKIQRPTAYDILGELENANLVTRSFLNGKKVFVAEEPAKLADLPRRQLSRIESVLPELNALFDSGPVKPRIRYYEGIEGIKTVSEDILTVSTKEYFWFGSIREILDVTGREYQRDWVKRRIAKGIWSNCVRVRQKEAADDFLKQGAKNLRRLRYFPKPIVEDTVALYIYDYKIAVTSALKESYGLIIESRELAVLLKALWDITWSIADEP
jgi:HTH-type transcriptional regulator, sugar sensing transcriptional regulator